jgi:hypothetical protein
MTVKELERAAIRAHARGETFTEFWENHEGDLRAAIPHDRRRFGTVYKHLLALVIAGDLSGIEPPGSDECAWLADDEAAKPHDTQTSARWIGLEAQR